jgi:hypothetical protein
LAAKAPKRKIVSEISCDMDEKGKIKPSGVPKD